MRTTLFLLLLVALSACSTTQKPLWYKGNLHTHSLWSDGDDYPEMIMAWYKDHGYHFIALSDHNTMQKGERWSIVEANAGGKRAYDKYLAQMGNWVEHKTQNDTLLVRLRTLEEYRSLFEKPNQFLIIPAEEITDRFEKKPIHINATNLVNEIRPQGGNSVKEVMQNNIDAVFEQRERLGIPMFPHINHPNFGWAITPDDIMELEGERFFEVYNGHPTVHNEGDETRPSTEIMWDRILSYRIAKGMPPMYGIATDDSHHYHDIAIGKSNTGRGWVMVDAHALTSGNIVRAMEEGSFYASSGVTVENISFDNNVLRIKIDGEPGISYTTEFIGTETGVVLYEEEIIDVDGRQHLRRNFFDVVGNVLKTDTSLNPTYTLTGNEMYVRARITSSKAKTNGSIANENESAWIQPVIPIKR